MASFSRRTPQRRAEPADDDGQGHTGDEPPLSSSELESSPSSAPVPVPVSALVESSPAVEASPVSQSTPAPSSFAPSSFSSSELESSPASAPVPGSVSVPVKSSQALEPSPASQSTPAPSPSAPSNLDASSSSSGVTTATSSQESSPPSPAPPATSHADPSFSYPAAPASSFSSFSVSTTFSPSFKLSSTPSSPVITVTPVETPSSASHFLSSSSPIVVPATSSSEGPSPSPGPAQDHTGASSGSPAFGTTGLALSTPAISSSSPTSKFAGSTEPSSRTGVASSQLSTSERPNPPHTAKVGSGAIAISSQVVPSAGVPETSVAPADQSFVPSSHAGAGPVPSSQPPHDATTTHTRGISAHITEVSSAALATEPSEVPSSNGDSPTASPSSAPSDATTFRHTRGRSTPTTEVSSASSSVVVRLSHGGTHSTEPSGAKGHSAPTSAVSPPSSFVVEPSSHGGAASATQSSAPSDVTASTHAKGALGQNTRVPLTPSSAVPSVKQVKTTHSGTASTKPSSAPLGHTSTVGSSTKAHGSKPSSTARPSSVTAVTSTRTNTATASKVAHLSSTVGQTKTATPSPIVSSHGKLTSALTSSAIGGNNAAAPSVAVPAPSKTSGLSSQSFTASASASSAHSSKAIAVASVPTSLLSVSETSTSSSSRASSTKSAVGDHNPGSTIATVIPVTIPSTTAFVNSLGSSTTAVVFITSSSTSEIVVPTSNGVLVSTSSKKNTFIAGAAGGGVGFFILFILAALLFCRWRKRRHAPLIDWDSTRGSNFACGGGSSPRSGIRSSSVSHSTSQMTQDSNNFPQYAIYVDGPPTPSRTSPYSDVSPRLMLHTPGNTSRLLYDIHDEQDPFADPIAVARVRPSHRSISPTIRESDMTMVENAISSGAWIGRSGMPTLKEGRALDKLDPFKDPAPQLYASPSGRNRLSNISSHLSSPATDSESLRGVAM